MTATAQVRRQERRYAIVSKARGFQVVDDDGRRAKVRLGPFWWEITSAVGTRRVPLYPGRTLSMAIAQSLADSRATVGSVRMARRQAADPLKALIAWEVQRLLLHVDPFVLAVQRSLDAVTWPDYAFLRWYPENLSLEPGVEPEVYEELHAEPGLYQDPYVARDIIAHRGAAIAAVNIHRLAAWWFRRVVGRPASRVILGPSDGPSRPAGSATAHPLFASGPGVDLVRALRDGSSDATSAYLALLPHWRDLFSDSGVTYRSLDRTLANLPEAVPHDLVCELANVRLGRPITDPLELLVVTLFARRYSASGVDRATLDQNADVFLNATHDQIARAMHRVGAYLGRELNTRTIRDVDTLVDGLVGFPEPHRGSIAGLADKAIAWYRETRARRHAATLVEMEEHLPAARPPIPPPGLPCVRLLATAREIYEEGAAMEHCLATYVGAAVAGRCYLFHVERGTEEATVLVDERGHIGEACGPHNRPNRASAWGSWVLARWGSGFPDGDDAGARTAAPVDGDDTPACPPPNREAMDDDGMTP